MNLMATHVSKTRAQTESAGIIVPKKCIRLPEQWPESNIYAGKLDFLFTKHSLNTACHFKFHLATSQRDIPTHACRLLLK